MLYQPEFVIYLWLLPVFGLLILPVLWKMSCTLYQSWERSRMADVHGFLDLSTVHAADQSGQERRSCKRIMITGPKAKVARQMKCCQTFVANISSSGICLRELPKKMSTQADDTLKVVFRTRERDYRMLVRPRWKKPDGRGHIIGAEILHIPNGWERFVNGLSMPSSRKGGEVRPVIQ